MNKLLINKYIVIKSILYFLIIKNNADISSMDTIGISEIIDLITKMLMNKLMINKYIVNKVFYIF